MLITPSQRPNSLNNMFLARIPEVSPTRSQYQQYPEAKTSAPKTSTSKTPSVTRTQSAITPTATTITPTAITIMPTATTLPSTHKATPPVQAKKATNTRHKKQVKGKQPSRFKNQRKPKANINRKCMASCPIISFEDATQDLANKRLQLELKIQETIRKQADHQLQLADGHRDELVQRKQMLMEILKEYEQISKDKTVLTAEIRNMKQYLAEIRNKLDQSLSVLSHNTSLFAMHRTFKKRYLAKQKQKFPKSKPSLKKKKSKLNQLESASKTKMDV